MNVSSEEVLARLQAGEPGFEVLASRLDLGREPVAPRWAEGETWRIETFYRQMQAAREVWSGPALWSFRVSREVSFRDRPCWEIIVERLDEPSFPASVYYVTRDGYRLAGVQTTVQSAGKLRTVTYVPEELSGAPEAVKAPLSIVPFDLPPVGAEAARATPGLGFEVEPSAGLPEAGRRRMPRPDDVLGAGGLYLDVQYENPLDRTLIRQRWSPGDMRWPAISRTETTWSFRRREP